eukprot:CAMPEP_0184311356 /NCGR_PEP_ID=MMETSP1049-20130417/41406_1 /TAXON_ID=77928 /ORGANISM="Proteomonas sulcata, Strain CCMP704" /LENGTH=318 /DNA_ID=CAMNT_0026626679 /DNA_START=24 /DNA_END=980 /DNA_ORIENTATION=+
MFKPVVLLGAFAAAEAFMPAAPLLSANRGVARRSPAISALRMQETPIKLTPQLFTELDKDASGTIDANEFKDALSKMGGAREVDKIFARADVNGDGEISYDEYVRLMNMDKFGDEEGGNTFVRSAKNIGLLKSDTVLGYTAMVGNKGFDPLGLAGEGADETTLNNYREAEIKHGRLAMLAAVGWPVAEELQPKIAALVGKQDLLVGGQDAAYERVPSVLNGGLENISPAFFAIGIIFSAAVEFLALQWGGKVEEGEYQPGDLGFDPLGLYRGKEESVRYDYRLKELNNGRLAMLAITWYAFEEFVTQRSVLANAGIGQ